MHEPKSKALAILSKTESAYYLEVALYIAKATVVSSEAE